MSATNTRAQTTARLVSGHIESFLQTVTQGCLSREAQAAEGERSKQPGHPVVLPSIHVWMAVLVGVLRGVTSIRAIWRSLGAQGYEGGDQAVYARLGEEGWKPFAKVCDRVSDLLVQWLQPARQAYQQRHAILAPFATEVVALDEMHLDQVKKRLPMVRHGTKGDREVLPGKLVALFAVRWQQWRTIDSREHASKNGLEHAKALLGSLKPGALLFADVGYDGFEWFDSLTEQGDRWIARVKVRTSVVIVPTYSEGGDTFDRLVWLGAWNTHGKQVVRQIHVRQGGPLRQSFTNVCDPTVLPLREMARLYSRRWDIEWAFLTLKRDVGLHVIWSSTPVVVRAQVWACLIRAQIVQAIRLEVALRADGDAFEVSLSFLLENVPQLGSHGNDPLVA